MSATTDQDHTDIDYPNFTIRAAALTTLWLNSVRTYEYFQGTSEVTKNRLIDIKTFYSHFALQHIVNHYEAPPPPPPHAHHEPSYSAPPHKPVRTHRFLSEADKYDYIGCKMDRLRKFRIITFFGRSRRSRVHAT